MTDQTVLIIAGVAALAIVVMFFKLLGSVIKAVVIAAIAAGTLYALLPRLEAQEGAVGEAAQKARAVTSDLEGAVEKIKSGAKELTGQIKEGVKKTKEASKALGEAKEAAEKAKEAVDKVPAP
jgi:uncharacterized protein YjbJ (UPF0337 family)